MTASPSSHSSALHRADNMDPSMDTINSNTTAMVDDKIPSSHVINSTSSSEIAGSANPGTTTSVDGAAPSSDAQATNYESEPTEKIIFFGPVSDPVKASSTNNLCEAVIVEGNKAVAVSQDTTLPPIMNPTHNNTNNADNNQGVGQITPTNTPSVVHSIVANSKTMPPPPHLPNPNGRPITRARSQGVLANNSRTTSSTTGSVTSMANHSMRTTKSFTPTEIAQENQAPQIPTTMSLSMSTCTTLPSHSQPPSIATQRGQRGHLTRNQSDMSSSSGSSLLGGSIQQSTTSSSALPISSIEISSSASMPPPATVVGGMSNQLRGSHPRKISPNSRFTIIPMGSAKEKRRIQSSASAASLPGNLPTTASSQASFQQMLPPEHITHSKSEGTQVTTNTDEHDNKELKLGETKKGRFVVKPVSTMLNTNMDDTSVHNSNPPSRSSTPLKAAQDDDGNSASVVSRFTVYPVDSDPGLYARQQSTTDTIGSNTIATSNAKQPSSPVAQKKKKQGRFKVTPLEPGAATQANKPPMSTDKNNFNADARTKPKGDTPPLQFLDSVSVISHTSTLGNGSNFPPQNNVPVGLHQPSLSTTTIISEVSGMNMMPEQGGVGVGDNVKEKTRNGKEKKSRFTLLKERPEITKSQTKAKQTVGKKKGRFVVTNVKNTAVLFPIQIQTTTTTQEVVPNNAGSQQQQQQQPQVQTHTHTHTQQNIPQQMQVQMQMPIQNQQLQQQPTMLSSIPAGHQLLPPQETHQYQQAYLQLQGPQMVTMPQQTYTNDEVLMQHGAGAPVSMHDGSTMQNGQYNQSSPQNQLQNSTYQTMMTPMVGMIQQNSYSTNDVNGMYQQAHVHPQTAPCNFEYQQPPPHAQQQGSAENPPPQSQDRRQQQAMPVVAPAATMTTTTVTVANSQAPSMTPTPPQEASKSNSTTTHSKPPIRPNPTSKTPKAYDSKGNYGAVGLGRAFHFVDQLKAEITDADRSIKCLHTDLKFLRDKNKDLESKNRELDRQWKEERKAREGADKRVSELRKQLQSLQDLQKVQLNGATKQRAEVAPKPHTPMTWGATRLEMDLQKFDAERSETASASAIDQHQRSGSMSQQRDNVRTVPAGRNVGHKINASGQTTSPVTSASMGNRGSNQSTIASGANKSANPTPTKAKPPIEKPAQARGISAANTSDGSSNVPITKNESLPSESCNRKDSIPSVVNVFHVDDEVALTHARSTSSGLDDSSLFIGGKPANGGGNTQFSTLQHMTFPLTPVTMTTNTMVPGPEATYDINQPMLVMPLQQQVLSYPPTVMSSQTINGNYSQTMHSWDGSQFTQQHMPQAQAQSNQHRPPPPPPPPPPQQQQQNGQQRTTPPMSPRTARQKGTPDHVKTYSSTSLPTILFKGSNPIHFAEAQQQQYQQHVQQQQQQQMQQQHQVHHQQQQMQQQQQQQQHQQQQVQLTPQQNQQQYAQSSLPQQRHNMRRSSSEPNAANAAQLVNPFQQGQADPFDGLVPIPTSGQSAAL